MGVIFKQSLYNTIYTYLGFVIGAINTLFLYTNFMSDDDYGLIGYMISVANVVTPLLNCGVQNTMIKFYSSYQNKTEQRKFNFMMFLLPWLMIIPVAAIGFLAYSNIGDFLSKQNDRVNNYIWLIFLIAVSMAYFEVFYSWTKVHYKSVTGNFMKEVFHRAVVMILLFALHFNLMSIQSFIYAVAIMYFSRTIIMLFVAVYIKKPAFVIGLPKEYKNVFKYSMLIILAGSVAIVLLDIDKLMLGQYMELNNVAYYNVAVFIAIVIAVPARAMQQITTSITARILNENDAAGLEKLYKQSSLNLYIVSGVIFLLIILNLHKLYEMLPLEYSQGILVVFLISLAKLSENLLGINNAIIFNSKYYLMVLLFGVLLAGLTIVLNIVFIPIWGINGSAMATLISILVYNIIKVVFVHRKFNMVPFSKETLKATTLFLVISGVFYFWDFPVHPVFSIIIKSGLILLVCVIGILKFRLSTELENIWFKYAKLIRNYSR